ncbi:MAG: cbb3-type cytochrome c oxidase N-terminal domain-containing protein [Bacteroidia bacterium]
MNKMKIKIFLASLILLLSNRSMAAAATFNYGDFDTLYIKVMSVIILILILIVVGLLYMTLVAMKKINKPENAQEEERTTVEKLFSLHSLKHEKELMLDENFDGIVELDNPTPPWFNFMFYTTIVVAIIYGLWYHAGSGKLQTAEYEDQLAEAEVAKTAYLKKVGNAIDESNVKAIADAKQLAEGKTLFNAKCAVCHREDAGGNVGPNLTDEFWLHGGQVSDIFKTIKYGVTGKGMIAWEKSLNGLQMAQLASYILTLQGTNPVAPKAPQGTKIEASSATDTTKVADVKTDSLVTASK